MNAFFHRLFFRPPMRLWVYGRVVRCSACGLCYWFAEVTKSGRKVWRKVST